MVRSLANVVAAWLFSVIASGASAMFIQADQLSPNVPGVGTSRYSYSNNDPLNLSDPSGEAFGDWFKSQSESDAANSELAKQLDSMARDQESLIGTTDEHGVPLDSRAELSAAFLRQNADWYRNRIGVSRSLRMRLDLGLTVRGVAAVAAVGVGVRTMPVKTPTPLGSARYGPMSPGPLPSDVARTFRSGSYTATITSSPTTLYRSYGGTAGPLGQYWTRNAPRGPLQSQLDSALVPGWGNTATNTASMSVPRGVTIYEGFAGPQSTGVGQLIGGGSQVYIPRKNVNPGWIK